MISTELADLHRICRHVEWRNFGILPGASYPQHWFMLSYEETFELATTGTYSVPVEIVPPAVQEWRKLMDGATALTGRVGEIDEFGQFVGETLEVAVHRG